MPVLENVLVLGLALTVLFLLTVMSTDIVDFVDAHVRLLLGA